MFRISILEYFQMEYNILCIRSEGCILEIAEKETCGWKKGVEGALLNLLE